LYLTFDYSVNQSISRKVPIAQHRWEV